MNPIPFQIEPIGVLRTELKSIAKAPKNYDESSLAGAIHVDPPYWDALEGIAAGDTIVVVFWMHLADRAVLKVHPRGDRTRPKRGVFATRSPDRPNPVGISKLLVNGVRDGGIIEVHGVDVIDGTPVIDIKKRIFSATGRPLDEKNAMAAQSCVSPEGAFIVGVHEPAYEAANFRMNDFISPLGQDDGGRPVMNERNFPAGDVAVASADRIFEIRNPFPFRGATYICTEWAERAARNPENIRLSAPGPVSFHNYLDGCLGDDPASRDKKARAYADLPRPVRLALATSSTDSRDLVALAKLACDMIFDENGRPLGLRHGGGKEGPRPVILDEDLHEAVANNPHLPDPYKEVMVLRPGAQGGSEIIGEFLDERAPSHVFEYLRRNSYIPWGHYAANMAHDAVRYGVSRLSRRDMEGLRHLYYQRTYARIAEGLRLPLPARRKCLSPDELEDLRIAIVAAPRQGGGTDLAFDGTLWGWNYGFDFAPSGYRLHASHQMIHQQFAMVPGRIFPTTATEEAKNQAGKSIPAYACGDLVADFIGRYRETTGRSFFDAYEKAIRENRRVDGRSDRESSLVVYEDDHVALFVPKAQISQWELQLMAKGGVGNVVEADTAVRASLDRGILLALAVLDSLGARMVTSIEFSKRLTVASAEQRLLYSFLPRLPFAPGAFSEAQYRFVSGHYPEDFALACRSRLPDVERRLDSLSL